MNNFSKYHLNQSISIDNKYFYKEELDTYKNSIPVPWNNGSLDLSVSDWKTEKRAIYEVHLSHKEKDAPQINHIHLCLSLLQILLLFLILSFIFLCRVFTRVWTIVSFYYSIICFCFFVFLFIFIHRFIYRLQWHMILSCQNHALCQKYQPNQAISMNKKNKNIIL